MFNLVSLVTFVAIHEDYITPQRDRAVRFDYVPGLLMMQIYTMFLTDIIWWKCSLNFVAVWLLHYYRLNMVNPGK